MKKLFLVIGIILLVGSFILSGCAKTEPASSKTSTPEVNWPSVITFAGGPAGSGAYRRTAALVVLMSKYLNTDASAELVGNPAAQISTMAAGKADMCWPHWYVATQAYFGADTWKGDPVNLRVLIAGPGSAYVCVANGDSGIKTYPDLKGKKVQCIRSSKNWMDVVFEDMLQSYGMTMKDIIPEKWTSFTDEMNALNSGAADASEAGTSPVTLSPAYAQEDAIKPLRWVETPVNKLQYVADKMGSQVKIQDFPAGKLKLEPNPEPTLVEYMGIVCPANLPEDFAYQFAKMCFDTHKDEYQAIKMGISAYSVQGTIDAGSTLPIDAGVVKYLKEKGLWTAQLEARNEKLISEFGMLRKK